VSTFDLPHLEHLYFWHLRLPLNALPALAIFILQMGQFILSPFQYHILCNLICQMVNLPSLNPDLTKRLTLNYDKEKTRRGGTKMAKKARKTLTHAEAVKFGSMGGNKLLIWQKRHPEAAKKIMANVHK
jgi:hypothetical protein